MQALCDYIICHLFGIKVPGFNKDGLYGAFQRRKSLYSVSNVGTFTRRLLKVTLCG